MKEPITYLLEVLASSGLLLAAYTVLLERRTEFRWCRGYLIGLPVLAAAIPLLRIPVWTARTAVIPSIVAGEVTAEVLLDPVRQPLLTPAGIAWLIYGAGVFAMLGLLLRQYRSILRLERGAGIERLEGIRLVRSSRPIASFSFFRTIYLHADVADTDLPAIIAHERSHIHHRHSLERIVMEMLKALLWWNPFVWIASRRLVEVEEFEADRDVLMQGCALSKYTETIFRQQFGHTPEIANGLRDSLTKKRFKMMTQNTQSRHARLRIAATLPIVATLVVAFGFTARATVVRTGTTTDNPSAAAEPARTITITGRIVEGPDGTPVADAKIAIGESFSQLARRTEEEGRTPTDAVTDSRGTFTLQGPSRGYIVAMDETGSRAGGISYTCEETAESLSVLIRLEQGAPAADKEEAFLHAEVMPSFDGGTLADFRQWIQLQIRYPEEAVKADLQGRVIAQFVIERDGTLDEIEILQSPGGPLSEEARRLLKRSPKWTPGTHQGEAVRVKFTLPIEFRLQGRAAENETNTLDGVTVVAFAPTE